MLKVCKRLPGSRQMCDIMGKQQANLRRYSKWVRQLVVFSAQHLVEKAAAAETPSAQSCSWYPSLQKASPAAELLKTLT